MSEFEQPKSTSGQHAASRRTFLKGVGVTMALPWLESVPVWGAATMIGDVPAPARSGSRPCLWVVASIRRTGGPKAPAPRWSWVRAWNRCPP